MLVCMGTRLLRVGTVSQGVLLLALILTIFPVYGTKAIHALTKIQ